MGAHGGVGEVAAARDLDGWEAVEVAQQHDFALRGGQLHHRGHEQLVELAARDDGGRRVVDELGGGGDGLAAGATRLAAPLPQREVADDGGEPAAPCAGRARRLHQHGDPRVLHDVVGQLLVGDEVARETAEEAGVFAQRGGEGDGACCGVHAIHFPRWRTSFQRGTRRRCQDLLNPA